MKLKGTASDNFFDDLLWRWKPHYPDKPKPIVSEESKKSALDIQKEKEEDKLKQVHNLKDLFEVQGGKYYESSLDRYNIKDEMISLMRAIAFEVAKLHRSNITHGNLNPNTVALTYAEGSFIVDISTDQPQGTCEGDMYDLGMLLLFCVNGGYYTNKRASTSGMNPEAEDLICQLIRDSPDKRPRAETVIRHPLFWDVRKRLDFLSKASYIVDRVEGELRVALLGSLKNRIARALDGGGFDADTLYRTNDICNDATHMYDSGTIGFFLRRMDYALGKKNFRPEYWMSFCENQCPQPLLIEVYNVMTKYAEAIAQSGIDSTFVREYLIDDYDQIEAIIKFVKKLLVGVCIVGALKNVFSSC